MIIGQHDLPWYRVMVFFLIHVVMSAPVGSRTDVTLEHCVLKWFFLWETRMMWQQLDDLTT